MITNVILEAIKPIISSAVKSNFTGRISMMIDFECDKTVVSMLDHEQLIRIVEINLSDQGSDIR